LIIGLPEGDALRARRRDRLVRYLREQVRERLGRPEIGPRKKPVRYQAERPDVRLRRDLRLLRLRLLRRHIERRAEDLARARDGFCSPELARRPRELRDAEIEELDPGRPVLARGYEQVLRLQIAMDDAHAVGFVERARGLLEIEDG